MDFLACSKSKFVFTAVAASFLVSGCGGGGNNNGRNNTPASPVAANVQGSYEGTVSDGERSTDFQLLILEDGTYFALSGTNSEGTFFSDSLIQGSGTETSSSKFTSSNYLNFAESPPPIPGNIELTFGADKIVSGAINITSNDPETLTLTGRPISSTTYDYNAAAKLSDISGSWLLTSLYEFSAGVALEINADGSYTGADQVGCTFSGNFVPRSSGKNVFNVTVVVGAAPCILPGATYSGVAVRSFSSSGSQQLQVAGTIKDRSTALALAGVRSD